MELPIMLTKKTKRLFLFFIIFIISSLCYAEEWKTIKEKKVTWQYIVISENGSGLVTFAASTTYRDGVLIFYCHAGERDKNTLNDLFKVCENELNRDENSDIVKYSSEYVQLLRTTKVLNIIDFNTDAPEYTSDGIPCVKSHIYCSSWLDKVLK